MKGETPVEGFLQLALADHMMEEEDENGEIDRDANVAGKETYQVIAHHLVWKHMKVRFPRRGGSLLGEGEGQDEAGRGNSMFLGVAVRMKLGQ